MPQMQQGQTVASIWSVYRLFFLHRVKFWYVILLFGFQNALLVSPLHVIFVRLRAKSHDHYPASEIIRLQN